MTSRWIAAIARWWRAEHPPLARDPEWRKAWQDERKALASGNTQALGRARKAMKAAVSHNLRGVA